MEIKDKAAEFAEKYGDSFYIWDAARFEANYMEMQSAFRKYYKNTHIAYSYKTNYMPQLCRTVDRLSGYAEVVSEMEWQLARTLGVKPQKIYYNGPYKKEKYLEEVLCAGGYVNLDSFHDVEMVKRIAKREKEKVLHVGIRCNFDIGLPGVSRFGFDGTNKEQLESILKELRDVSNISVCGLHCHFPVRALETYEKRMDGMTKLLKQFFCEPPEYVSFGGGYYGKMEKEFAAQFRSRIPAYEDYAQIIAGRFAELYPDAEKTKLIIEPGSALVADTMYYAARVVDIKNIRGRNIATLSGSLYNINPSAKSIQRPVEVISMGAEQKFYEDIDMAGYTCIEDDYLYRGYSGKIGLEDVVIFKNVGSYSIVFKPPFILPNVPVVDMEGNEIKRQEKFEDVFGTYRL